MLPLLSLIMTGLSFSAISAPTLASKAGHATAHRLDRLAWSQLHFKMSIMGLPLHAKIGLSILDNNEIKSRLIDPEQGQGVPPGHFVLMLDITSSFISDKDIHTRLFLNPDDASVLQRTRLELTKGDERYKAYRFTDEGIFILRRKPRPRENNHPYGHWSDIKTYFEPYPGRLDQYQIISDTSALLYIGSTAAFDKPNDKKRFIAYFDDDFHVITIEYAGLESIRADFTAQKGGGAPPQHIMSYRDASQLIIHAHPLGHPREKSTLQIAGLEPPVKLFVDRELGIPLELRGSLGFMGEVSLRLHEVTLRRP